MYFKMNKDQFFWEKGNWIGEEGERLLKNVQQTKTSLELLFPTCD